MLVIYTVANILQGNLNFLVIANLSKSVQKESRKLCAHKSNVFAMVCLSRRTITRRIESLKNDVLIQLGSRQISQCYY